MNASAQSALPGRQIKIADALVQFGVDTTAVERAAYSTEMNRQFLPDVEVLNFRRGIYAIVY